MVKRLAILLAILSTGSILVAPLHAADKTAAANELVATQAKDAPRVELTTLARQETELRDYRGRVTLVHFWATWCAPCLEELPELEAVQRKYPDTSLRVLAIAADSHDAVQAFRRDHGLGLTVLVDQYGGAMRAYKVEVLPVSYLVDRRGRLRYRADGRVDWRGRAATEIVQDLISEN